MQSSYAQSAYRGSSSSSSYTVDRLVTTVFRDLATNESMVSVTDTLSEALVHSFMTKYQVIMSLNYDESDPKHSLHLCACVSLD